LKPDYPRHLGRESRRVPLEKFLLLGTGQGILPRHRLDSSRR
jgi:hypothetical protein